MKTRRPSGEKTIGSSIHGVAGIVLEFLVLVLSACAGKFTRTTEADMGFFAGNTISMHRDANLGFSRRKAL
jgi:hypothetical protein